jgi:hypothetical protein
LKSENTKRSRKPNKKPQNKEQKDAKNFTVAKIRAKKKTKYPRPQKKTPFRRGLNGPANQQNFEGVQYCCTQRACNGLPRSVQNNKAHALNKWTISWEVLYPARVRGITHARRVAPRAPLLGQPNRVGTGTFRCLSFFLLISFYKILRFENRVKFCQNFFCSNFKIAPIQKLIEFKIFSNINIALLKICSDLKFAQI